jgi:hypothetical protein
MKNCPSSKNHVRGRIPALARAATLVMAFSAAPNQAVHAQAVTAPQVPSSIQAPSGHKAFLVGQAVGTQNYICKRVGSDIKFVLFTPEAVLTKGNQQLTSHFFSPNPFEANSDRTVVSDHMIRATWRHSRDASTVWAKAIPNAVGAVTPNAIPWLLLQVVGAKDGFNGGDTLTATTFIQRVNTTGGMAPSTGCSSPTEVGNQAFVPYTADYVFYKESGDGRMSASP